MKKHKLLAVLLVLAMTLSLLPTVALAEGETAITTDTSALTTGNYILNEDVTRTSALTVAEGETATLDLNGHTISSTNFTTIINNGTLTIKDSAGSGRVVSTGAVAVGAGDNSTTTIKSGTFESVEGAVITGYATGATINIEGGTFSASDNAVVAGNGNRTNKSGATRENPNTINISGGIFNGGIVTTSYVACGIYAPWKDTINVSGGTFNITGGAGIVARAGNVNVTGGTFNTTGNATGKVGDSRVVVPCSAIVFDSAANYPAMTADSKITVTGGKFTSAVDVVATVEPESSVATRVAVSGGTFSSNPGAYLVNGFSATENAGTWTISDPVAEIGDVKYGTLAAAIAAVPSSGTQPTVITLLKNVENAPGMAVTGGKNFIVDFAGHTYTLNKPGAGSTNTETNGFQLLKGSTIVFKGGTINISESNLTPAESGKNIMRVIQNYANLTLEDMTIDGTNQYGSASYVMSFNNDPVSIIGNTSIIAAEGEVAFDADGNWGPYQRCTVTVNTTGTITGNIEVGRGYLNIENAEVEGGIVLCTSCGESETTGQAERISVTGGTFSSKPADDYVASGYHAVAAGSGYTVHEIVTEPQHTSAAATCTTDGNVDYYTCSGCGADVYYSDAECANRLDEVVLPALGHDFAEAWTTSADKHWHDCSRCDVVSGEAAHTFEKTGIVGGAYEWTCNVCGYSKTGAADAHAIDTTKVTNGTVVAEPNPATVGQSVKLTLTPKDGYNDSDVQLYYSYDDVVDAELSGLTFIMPDAAVTISGAFKPIEYKITYNLDGGTNSTANPSTYTVLKGFSLTAPTKSGYTFLGWSFNNNSGIIKEVSVKDGSTGNITFTAHWSYNGGSSSGGGGGSTGGSSSSTTTEKNPDGSTTTTTTDKTTGTVTETTKNTDGSTTTVETKKDGTVTETVKTPEGVTGTVVTDKNGDLTEAKATVSTTAAKEAAKTGEAVTLPVEVPAVKTTEEAPALQVTVPKSADSVKVEIPVEKVTPGTVAVIVNADGTEKIVSTSMVTENGVALTLDGSATVKIIDNSKSFTDVPADSVFYNEISSLSAREIMVGKTDDKFDLHSSVTLDQIANVAGRITGAVDVKDFSAGVTWGAESGLKTGNVSATRGDVLKALYIAAGSPTVEDTTILARFKDASGIPADMAAIAAWAAQNGILKGDLSGNANLTTNVTRGQACALAGRTMGTLA